MRRHLIRLHGGLDTSNAPMAVSDGCAIGSLNYQERVVEGGYERVRGYEPYDGRPRPSDAEVVVLGADGEWSVSASVGTIVTGAISGAQAVVCYYSSSVLGLTKRVGDFSDGEQIMVGASPAGTNGATPSVSQLVMNDVYAGAEALYRADIDEVPGSGPVRGVFVQNDTVFAFRDNAAGTKQELWKATSSGWVAVTLHRKVRFSGGSWVGGYEGGGWSIKQGSVTASVWRTMTESGDWLDGTAAGTLVVGEASGGELASGAATDNPGGSVTLTLSGAPSDIVLAAGGRWQFRPYRFSLNPSTITEVTYGVDRTDDGGGNFIEFDGYNLAPLTAGGMDGPYRLETHKNHLFVVYRRTSVQFSSLGEPYRWSVLSGAGEILAGERVTELLSVPGSEDQAAMLILCENRSFVLYGNSSADFKLSPLSRQVGAKQYSAQAFNPPLAYDEHGVRSYSPTDAFGNFTHETLTNHVRSDVVGRTPVASAIDRAGGRYRLYFDDGSWLSGTPGKRWSWMQCKYPVIMNCVQDWELDGETVILAGGSDGYVHMLDKGRTFGGEAIEAWLKLAYASFGADHIRKAFRGVHVEIRGESAGALKVQADYSYGSSEISAKSPSYEVVNPIPPAAAPWDLGTWDNSTWDSQYATILRVGSVGVGDNVSMTFYSNADNERSHIITTVMHFFLPRRMVRPT
jgi:hypothetical protein